MGVIKIKQEDTFNAWCEETFRGFDEEDLVKNYKVNIAITELGLSNLEEFEWGYSGDTTDHTYCHPNDVKNYIADGGKDISEWTGENFTQKTRDWHLGRASYFVNRPNEIKDIEVVDTLNDRVAIADGNHRLLAGMVLRDWGKMVTVPVLYTGRKSVLNKLVEDTQKYI